MATASDVAAYILREQGPMSTWKLQKLVYYAQAWSLVWDEAPLYDDRIEAWANGPVVRSLYDQHRRRLTVAAGDLPGDADALTDVQRETVDSVLRFYGDKTGQWLSELTHQERPWIEAREGLRPGQRGQRAITEGALADYYGSL